MPTQDVKKAGFRLASFNSLHWLCSLIWRSPQSWYEPNSHRSEKREPSGSVMAIVTNQPRRNLGTFTDNSLNRSCNQYLLPQPLFWSMVQKKKHWWKTGLAFYTFYRSLDTSLRCIIATSHHLIFITSHLIGSPHGFPYIHPEYDIPIPYTEEFMAFQSFLFALDQLIRHALRWIPNWRMSCKQQGWIRQWQIS